MEVDNVKKTGQLELKKEDFDWFRYLIKTETGINIFQGKYNFLYNRLSARLRKLGIDSFIEYRRFLKTVEGREKEFEKLLDTIITPESKFFRYKPHMDMLISDILPSLSKEKLADGQPVNILSVGCARGEEPYSLAILACEKLSAIGREKLRITGLDLSHTLLSEAEKATYTDGKLENMPSEYLERYFVQDGDKYRLIKKVTRMVDFQRFNIINDNWKRFSVMDLIMCRNTIIYFEEYTRKKVLSNVVDQLSDGGYLAMGHTEMIEASEYGLEHLGHNIYTRVND